MSKPMSKSNSLSENEKLKMQLGDAKIELKNVEDKSDLFLISI